MTTKVAVLGSGSWGTALAKSLSDAGHEVRLWARRAEQAEAELCGKALNSQVWQHAADAVAAIAEPTDDVRGSSEFKRQLLRGLFLKAGDTATRRSANAIIEGSHVYA